MTKSRVLRWPSTWALAAAIAFATLYVALRSCSVLSEVTGLDVRGAIRRHIAALAGRAS